MKAQKERQESNGSGKARLSFRVVRYQRINGCSPRTSLLQFREKFRKEADVGKGKLYLPSGAKRAHQRLDAPYTARSCRSSQSVRHEVGVGKGTVGRGGVVVVYGLFFVSVEGFSFFVSLRLVFVPPRRCFPVITTRQNKRRKRAHTQTTEPMLNIGR